MRPTKPKNDDERKRPSRPALSMMTRPKAEPMIEPDAEILDEEARAAAQSKAAAELATSVGWEIRSLRLSLNMSAQDLARRSGVSNGMISKLENGQATASFATLIALSTALQVPVARLFVSHQKASDYSLVPAGRGISVRRQGMKKGFDYQLLGHLLTGEKFTEPYLVTIDADTPPNPAFQHTGIEFIYILSGKMTFRYGEDLMDLGPGDSLTFEANTLHGHEKIIQGPVRLLSVIFNLRK